MNQDVTAPATVRGMNVSNSLSDATAEFALYDHARMALNNLRLSDLTALSRNTPTRELPQLRIMKSAVSAAVVGFNEIFAGYAAATLVGEASSITSGRVMLQGLTGRGHSYSEVANIAIERSVSSTEEPRETTLERFIRALGEWKGLIAPDHFDAITWHIDRMLSDQEELDEDNVVISPSSFDDMLAFLSSRPWDSAPAVGMSRKGQFSASWARPSPHADVTLTFLGEGLVRWYVYGLGRKGTGSATGSSDRYDLPGLLLRLDCDSWMAR